MKFWDTSAIVPLLVEENFSERASELLLEDDVLVVWWGTSIECISAISRLERDGQISGKAAAGLVLRLQQLRDMWNEIQPSALVKQHAERILKLHPLRAQDAQQLAAAIVANLDVTVEVITFDEPLSLAAQKEGLRVTVARS